MDGWGVWTDRRSRVLVAVRAGESPEAAACRFAVGCFTAYRWVAASRDEGGMWPSGGRWAAAGDPV